MSKRKSRVRAVVIEVASILDALPPFLFASLVSYVEHPRIHHCIGSVSLQEREVPKSSVG